MRRGTGAGGAGTGRTHPGLGIMFESSQARAPTPVHPLPTSRAAKGVLGGVFDFVMADAAEVFLGGARVWTLTRQQKKEKEGRGRIKEGMEERRRRLT